MGEWSGKPQFDTHRSTSLQRAAIWATQHQNSSVSPPLQNKSTTAFGLNRGRLNRRLGVAIWPTPSRVFTPRLESNSHEQPRNGIETPLPTNRNRPTPIPEHVARSSQYSTSLDIATLGGLVALHSGSFTVFSLSL